MYRLLLAFTACYFLSACTQPIVHRPTRVQSVEFTPSQVTLVPEATVTPTVLSSMLSASDELGGSDDPQPLPSATVTPTQMSESTPVVRVNPVAAVTPNVSSTLSDTQVPVQPASEYVLFLPLIIKNDQANVGGANMQTDNHTLYLPLILSNHETLGNAIVGSGSQISNVMHTLFLPIIVNDKHSINSTNEVTPANHLLFLPLIVNEKTEPADYRFQFDEARLLPVRRSDAQYRDTTMCGEAHQLSVHVYDACVDCDQTHRLNQIRVKVVQVDQNGNESIDYQSTGERTELGMAPFELQQHAKIQLVDETHNDAPLSEVYEVWTHTPKIDTAQLIAAGYCSGEGDCWTFASQNRCDGRFSWEVVFKEK